MGFASAWLEQNSHFPRIITEAPAQNTGIIVVVPAFDEPGITNLLDSFAGNRSHGSANGNPASRARGARLWR